MIYIFMGPHLVYDAKWVKAIKLTSVQDVLGITARNMRMKKAKSAA